MATLAAEVKARLQTLGRRRDPWTSLWQELAQVFLPGKAQFNVQSREAERDAEPIFDGTPRLAARDLASAIDGLIKPKTSNWFEPTVEDERLSRKREIKEWLELVRERMWRVIYRKEARFIQRSSEVDDALVVFGWGTLWTTENKMRNNIMFRTFHNKDVAIDENAEGIVDTIAVNEELTARQAVGRFGDKVHKEIAELAVKEEGPHAAKKFPFAQLVMPESDFLAGKIGRRGMPYSAVTIDVTHEVVMSEGGFHEFPAAVPRWETEPCQVYPRSPALVALPDALTLQAISKTLLVGGERAADPPLMVPSDAFLSPVRTFPGGISVFDVQALADGELRSPVFPLPTSSALPVGRDMQLDYRTQVQMAFFKHVLTLPVEGGNKTATEVLERKEEFIRVLGPIFGRLESDYIGAIVDRVFAIMDRAGAFPPRPVELEGVPIIFNFQSPLQQARKSIDVAGFNRTLEVTAPLAQVQPWIYDNIDGDKIMRDSPEWSGIPQSWLKTEDEVASTREERAAAESQATAVETAKPVADSLKSIAQAQQLNVESGIV